MKARKRIRKLIKKHVWVSRSGKTHGIWVAADAIESEVVEAAYQEGFRNGQDPVDGLVRGVVTTRTPEHYLLVNIDDSTFWRLSSEGRWLRATELQVADADGKIVDTLKLGKKAS